MFILSCLFVSFFVFVSQMNEKIQAEWINTTSNAQPRNPLWVDKQEMQQIKHLTAEANHLIHMIHTKNITETNAHIYAM